MCYLGGFCVDRVQSPVHLGPHCENCVECDQAPPSFENCIARVSLATGPFFFLPRNLGKCVSYTIMQNRAFSAADNSLKPKASIRIKLARYR
jgi:hypothetical protein